MMRLYRQINPIHRIYGHATLGAITFIIAIFSLFNGNEISAIVNAAAFFANIYTGYLQVKELEINV